MKYAAIDAQETCYLSVCDILSGDYASKDEAKKAMSECYTMECFYVRPLTVTLQDFKKWPEHCSCDVYHEDIRYYSKYPSTEGFISFTYIKNYLIKGKS